MQSYRLDSADQLIDFHGCEIGLITLLLKRRQWGRVTVNSRLRSEHWWKTRLAKLISSPTVTIAPENLWDGRPVDYPMPYEVEFGMSNASDCAYWLENHA